MNPFPINALEFRIQGLGKKLFVFALKFYKDFGCRVAGIRKRNYRDTGEDAVLMKLEI